MKGVATAWVIIVAVLMLGFGMWIAPQSVLVSILSVGSSIALAGIAVWLVKDHHGIY